SLTTRQTAISFWLATSRRSFLTANCRPLRLPGNSVKVLIETGSSEKAMPGAECSTKVSIACRGRSEATGCDAHWESALVGSGRRTHQIREVGARAPSWMPCLSGRPLRLLRPANDYVIRHPAGIRRRRSLACRKRHRHATLRSREHAAAVRRLNGWGGRGAERMAGQSRPMQRSTMLSTNLY